MSGLEAHGLDLKKVAKEWGKKFATGSSVTKTAGEFFFLGYAGAGLAREGGRGKGEGEGRRGWTLRELLYGIWSGEDGIYL